jgi:hypothetical protein
VRPKRNQKADPNTSDERDRCETPAYALDPLLPYLRREWCIWEPACGTGRLVRALSELGYQVKGSDLLDGVNFFEATAPYEHKRWDCIVTNPPYSIKPEWIECCYSLGKPFALLVPVETIGLGVVQRIMEQHGAELLLLNKRVNFYMPEKGLDGNGAQFPVLWFCWQLLGKPLVYGRLTRRLDEQLLLPLEVS